MLKRQKQNLRQRGAVGDKLAQTSPHGKLITSRPNNPAKPRLECGILGRFSRCCWTFYLLVSVCQAVHLQVTLEANPVDPMLTLDLTVRIGNGKNSISFFRKSSGLYVLCLSYISLKQSRSVHCRVLIILVAVSHAAVCHKFDVNWGTLLACKASVCAAYACLRKFLIPVSLLFCKAFDSIVCSPFRKACSKESFCPDSTGKASLSVRSLWVFARCCNA